MIPKVIHYCWFGGKEMSPFVKKCVQTWAERMPDYELRLWDAHSFDFDSVSFVREAYQAKKWAFVADYVRLYALYTEGGIYMDTDVKVMKSFTPFLNYDFFTSHEVHPFFFEETEQCKIGQDMKPLNPNDLIEGFGVLSAVMGSVSGLPYLKECLDYYNTLHFDLEHHSKDDYTIGKHITRLILKYGYRFLDEDQLLNHNMMLMNSSVIVGNAIYLKKDSYAIHLCNGSWTDSGDDFNYWLRNNYPRIYSVWGIGLKVMNKLKRMISRK